MAAHRPPKSVSQGSSPWGYAKVYLCVRKSGLIYPPWKWEIAGSNPATQTSYVVLSVPVRTSLCESDRMGSTPIDQPKIICPGDGIGIHTGLRSRVLRVQVSPRAPKDFMLAIAQCIEQYRLR